MDLSQDGETGIYQKKDTFWKEIVNVYNSDKPSPHIPDRTKRSLETRMQVIMSSLSKFKGCVQQIEYLNPSGASEKDIFDRAKQLLTEDPRYKKGFKFEHVWPLMKDFVKFDCPSQRSSFQAETPPESPISPDGLSSFSINLSDGSGSGSGPTQRPDGVKKTKNKRKKGEDMSNILQAIDQGNKRLEEIMDNSSTKKDQIMQLQQQKIEAKKQALAFRKWEADNKILMIDTDNISDPIRRDYFKQEQTRIILKRQDGSGSSNAFNMFGDEFPNFGGSGSDAGGSEGDFQFWTLLNVFLI
ncbi:glutathione S-transferase T2-like [Salvia miltiorrhiza]|uniref:glutathione S-transferase T2-like n=1 Tax=Salvia miltiorrhiza TaxID=226208 RepID=UPI0025AB6D96|nr:glutathione S-transferase T2-like [Salvia miltiorrhiza]